MLGVVDLPRGVGPTIAEHAGRILADFFAPAMSRCRAPRDVQPRGEPSAISAARLAGTVMLSNFETQGPTPAQMHRHSDRRGYADSPLQGGDRGASPLTWHVVSESSDAPANLYRTAARLEG